MRMTRNTSWNTHSAQRGSAVLFSALSLTLACGGSAKSGGAPAAGGNGGMVSGGAPAAGGSGGMVSGGAPAAGGSGGGTVTGGASGDGSAIGTLGQPCSTGAYACAGHAQRQQLACVGGVWTANGTCAAGQNCDTRLGANGGACEPIVAECATKQANEALCQGLNRMACGADLVSTTAIEVCGGGCVSAACTACQPLAKQCMNNGVQTCDGSGVWGGAVACVDQACTGAGVCAGVCTPGAKRCTNGGAETCDASGVWGATPCADAAPVCSGAGSCGSVLSCAGLASTCGVSGNVNCCATTTVPGGTFNRSNDANYPATVSDFRLDNYEVTVGRFRKFVSAYTQGMIPAGAGKNANNSADPGWDVGWNASLPADAAALTAAVKCDATGQTWTDEAGANENRPINCVNWYEAQAFCTWDGGRLPTEAEWNYAAAGGSEQREYPWGGAAPGANASLAVYECVYNDNGTAVCDALDIAPVGSVVAGNGRWGQSDLAGNMGEWNQDWNSAYSVSCSNCSNFSDSGSREVRGGDFRALAVSLTSAARYNRPPANHNLGMGLRCARTR